MTVEFRALIGKVATGATLGRDEAAGAFEQMMAGEATPSQMGALLMALRVRGETVDEITGAVLLLQGEDDPVVPADQTRRMAEALTGRGIRCEARYFEGESHGFRRADTLIACFEAELAFYADVLLGAPEGA